MIGRRILLATPLLAAAGPAPAPPAAPSKPVEIRVFSTGAYRPVLDAVVPAFESRSGNKVTVTTDTGGGVAARVERGEPFDIAILMQSTAAGPQKDGKIILVTPIASVGIGVAVRAGAPRPDISTPDKLKAALLATPSVAMTDPASGGSSGIYLAKMLDQLGIATQMKPKLILTPGGLPAERIVSGQAVMAIGQESELLAVHGVTLVGSLPAPLQSRTVYVAGMSPTATEAPLILLAILASAETQATLKEKGLGPP